MAVTGQIVIQYSVPVQGAQSSLGNSITLTTLTAVGLQTVLSLSTTFVTFSSGAGNVPMLPAGTLPSFVFLIPDGTHDIWCGGSGGVSTNSTVILATAGIFGPIPVKAAPQLVLGASGISSVIAIWI